MYICLIMYTVLIYIQVYQIFFFRVNCYDSGGPQAPFGGFKMSGFGREWYNFLHINLHSVVSSFYGG